MIWRTIDDLDRLRPGRVSFRATHECFVFEADDEDGTDATLVCVFTGEVRALITKPFVSIQTEGDFWWFDKAIVQTVQRPSDEVYTSLDRPAPLSPEMLAIERMTRKNEIERENMRAEFERRLEHVGRPRTTRQRKDNLVETEVSDADPGEEPPAGDTKSVSKAPKQSKRKGDSPKTDAPLGATGAAESMSDGDDTPGGG